MTALTLVTVMRELVAIEDPANIQVAIRIPSIDPDVITSSNARLTRLLARPGDSSALSSVHFLLEQGPNAIELFSGPLGTSAEYVR
jgi:hypothetical protein